MTNPTVISLTVEDQPRAIATLVSGFSADPFNRWVYPDEDEYAANFPEMVKRFAGRAFDHGTAYGTSDFAGAALWLPPGVQSDQEALGELVEQTVREGTREKLFSLVEQMGAFHPTEPCWYLPLIGVDAGKQGKGYGSALMAHALLRCDQQGKPAYLESSNQRNLSLYERHGFKLIGKIQVEDAPVLWPMLREPRSWETPKKHRRPKARQR